MTVGSLSRGREAVARAAAGDAASRGSAFALALLARSTQLGGDGEPGPGGVGPAGASHPRGVGEPDPDPRPTRLWTASVGTGDLVLIARERPDRGHRIYVRWRDPASVQREKRAQCALGCRVRDAAGRREPQLELQAYQALLALYHELAAPAGAATAPVPPDRLTLAQGFALAFQPGAGMYPVQDDYVKDRQRAAADVLDFLDPALPWQAVRPATIEALAAALARAHHAQREAYRADQARRRGREPSGPPVPRPAGGPRWAEVVIQTLFRTAAWLRDNGYIDERACLPRPGWNERLAKIWQQITGQPVRPQHPRHTEDELRRLLRALPTAEPRLRLALEIGLELRLGQVLGTTRRAYDPAAPGTTHGRIEVPGTAQKPAGPVHLTVRQRAALDTALAGHLRHYEAAFQAGELEDYPLFPGGPLVAGVLAVDDRARRMNPRTLLRFFHALEQQAGVTQRRGRGWYGLRRLVADLVKRRRVDVRIADTLIRNDVTTRRRHYEDPDDPYLPQQAMLVRHELRLRAAADVELAP